VKRIFVKFLRITEPITRHWMYQKANCLPLSVAPHLVLSEAHAPLGYDIAVDSGHTTSPLCIESASSRT